MYTNFNFKKDDFVSFAIDNQTFLINWLSSFDLEHRVIEIVNDDGLQLLKTIFNGDIETNKTVKFSLKELSKGTRQLIVLAYYFFKYKNDNSKILLIDIDVHVLILKAIFEILNKDFIQMKSILFSNNKSLIDNYISDSHPNKLLTILTI